MKPCSVFIFLFCFLSGAFAQKVSYTYDRAGNRVKREIVIGKHQALSKQCSNDQYVDMLAEYKITITPNPTQGRVRVTVLNADLAFDIRVYSAVGQQVAYRHAEHGAVEVDLSGQPNGMYILVIALGEKESTWKVIKAN